MKQYLITQPPSSDPYSQTFDNLAHAVSKQQGMMLLGCVVLIGTLTLLGSRTGKGKLTKGKFGGSGEKAAAKRVAIQQMRERCKNAVSIWVGTPSNAPPGLVRKSPLYIPDAQRGTAVIGAPGTGKTVSIIDQAAISIFEQGFPAILWDFKYPTQTSRLAPYAAKLGYDVRIFAPGFPESEICNPLDFLDNETDSLMARQIAEVMNANFRKAGTSSEDSFFGPAGDQVTEGLLMLAKSTRYADLMMAQALVTRTNLAKQILNKRKELNPWILASFGQLISSADSEKTVSSILATAANNLTRFMKAELMPALVGESTIPTQLEGKQILVLGIDREKRDVLAPLIATVLHLLVNKNVTYPRKDPLFLLLDELPTLYLPSLHHWLNENREDGLCSILGYQNMVQLENKYGKELARAIAGGCATKFIFNPQDPESAKIFSDYLGEREVKYRQKSTGRSGGKPNTSYSDHIQTRPLFEVSDFLKLPTGRCVIINPHLKRGQTAYIPLVESVKLGSDYKTISKWCQKVWPKMRSRLIERSPLQEVTKEDLAKRYDLASEMFPSKTSKEQERDMFTALL